MLGARGRVSGHGPFARARAIFARRRRQNQILDWPYGTASVEPVRFSSVLRTLRAKGHVSGQGPIFCLTLVRASACKEASAIELIRAKGHIIISIFLRSVGAKPNLGFGLTALLRVLLNVFFWCLLSGGVLKGYRPRGSSSI